MYQGLQITPSKFSVNNTINIHFKKFIPSIPLIYKNFINYFLFFSFSSCVSLYLKYNSPSLVTSCSTQLLQE